MSIHSLQSTCPSFARFRQPLRVCYNPIDAARRPGRQLSFSVIQTTLDDLCGSRSEMKFYKLTTIRPCMATRFFAFMQALEVDADDDGVSQRLEFVDETGSRYRIELEVDRTVGYVSFDGTVQSKPNQVIFGHICRFVRFVKKNDLGLRRGKVELAASEGALISDLKWSDAYRHASHAACHPKDH